MPFKVNPVILFMALLCLCNLGEAQRVKNQAQIPQDLTPTPSPVRMRCGRSLGAVGPPASRGLAVCFDRSHLSPGRTRRLLGQDL